MTIAPTPTRNPIETVHALQRDAFLDHLGRGGSAGFYWTVNGDTKRSHWWNGSGRPEPPSIKANVYFGVHPVADIPITNADGKPLDSAHLRSRNNLVSALNCLFADIDAKDFGGDKAQALAHIEALPQPPSVIVDSGGGYHCYWLLTQPWVLQNETERKDAASMLAAWVEYTKGDINVKDLARVLRVPGTFNYKYNPPLPVAFVWCELDRLYSITELRKACCNTWAEGKLDIARRKVRNAPDGQKHHELLKAATLAGGVADTLGDTRITEALYDEIALRADDTTQALRTIQDGIAYGKKKPLTQATDTERAEDTRPEINRSTIDLPKLTAQAWDAILEHNEPPTLFRRGGELVRLEATDDGALVLAAVDERRLAGILARAARWVRITKTKDGPVVSDTAPPTAVVDDCMVNIDPRIPSIARVVHAPTFGPGGELLIEPGYHANGRLYFAPRAGVRIPPIPAHPTPDQVTAARTLILDELLADFPFVSDADRAHAVALFLLPFVREYIDGPTPLHLIEAPTMGSGKGLLAECLLYPALGTIATPMAEAGDDDEWRKRLTSTLIGGPAAIYLDNLNKTLDSGSLAMALTARELADRVLGKSEQIHLPVRCVWVATANNPALSTEISRRCIRIRIDPRIDKPWQRTDFKHTSLRAWVAEHQGELIGAALTLIRHGLPHDSTTKTLGSYEHWSTTMGRILAAADIPGFLGNLDELYNRADAEGSAWRALLASWQAKHDDTPMPAGELFPLVSETDADTLVSGRDDVGRKKSFGKALAKIQDRVFTLETETGTKRVRVMEAGTRHKAKLWQLVSVEHGGIGGLGAFSQPLAQNTNSLLALGVEKTHKTPITPTLTTAVWEEDSV